MPPAKTHDARVDGSTTRERQLASAAHARSKKQTLQSTNGNMQNGSTLKDLPLYNPDTAAQQPQTGVSLGRVYTSLTIRPLTQRCRWHGIPRLSNYWTPTASRTTSKPRPLSPHRSARLSSRIQALAATLRQWHGRKRSEGYRKSNWHWLYGRTSMEPL